MKHKKLSPTELKKKFEPSGEKKRIYTLNVPTKSCLS